MKRTLLAVGIAVLVSMMLVPHGDLYGPYFLTRTERITCFYPFFLDLWNQDFLPRAFVLQTIFLAVLAAVIVNLFRRKPKTPHSNAKVRLRWIIVGLLVLLVIAGFVINYFSQHPPATSFVDAGGVLLAQSTPSATPTPFARPTPSARPTPVRASSSKFRQIDLSLVESYSFTMNDSGHVEGWIRNKSSVPIDILDIHVVIKNFASDIITSETRTVSTQIPPNRAGHVSFRVSSSPARNGLGSNSLGGNSNPFDPSQFDPEAFINGEPQPGVKSPFDLFSENSEPENSQPENSQSPPPKQRWSWRMKIEAAGTKQR